MNIVKKISWASVVFALLELSLGICLIALPNQTLLTFCYFLFSLVIVAGACSIVNYFFFGFEPFGFLKGVAEIVIGVACLPLANVLAEPRVFSVLVGVVMLLSGLFKMQTSMDARRAFAKEWWLYLVYGGLLVVLSIIMLCYPFESQNVFLIFMGALLSADAVCDIVVAIVVNAKIGKVKREIKKEINE